MDLGQLILVVPGWALLLATLALSLAAVEAGAWVARRRNVAEPEAPVAAMVGAVLGLLAFILAFTFSLAANRFDARKQLIIEDANACAAAWLRAGLLPPANQNAVRPLLREYVEVRAQLAPTADLPALIAKTDELLVRIWQETEKLAHEDMDGEIRSLFVASVNDLFTLHQSRKTVGLVHRIPGLIWLALYALSSLSMFAIGYQVGGSGVRRLLAMPVLAAAFALVIVMIAEMDKPWGMFHISQQPMVDVQAMIANSAGPR